MGLKFDTNKAAVGELRQEEDKFLTLAFMRPHIAYLTSVDASDKRSWSGIHHYVSRALSNHCGEVSFPGPYRPSGIINRGKIRSYLTRKLTGKNYDYLHTTELAKAYGKYFSRKLKEKKFDLVFAAAASAETAFLETDLPILYFADTTFANMIGYYPYYTNLVKSLERQALELDRRGIRKSAALIYPSRWAAGSAIRDFGADPARVHLLPWGANMEEVPPAGLIHQKKRGDRCRLLFLGVEWDRKGGSIAFDTLLQLHEKGVMAELTVCGCIPPAGIQHADLKVIPFINKNNPEERKRLNTLFLNTDFLLLPTRAECYGIVFCEASAFGIPSIATHTGGVSGAVFEGVNGHLLPPEAGGKQYAEVIAGIFQDENRFCSLVKSARALYEKSLNWDAWARQVSGIIQPLLRR